MSSRALNRFWGDVLSASSCVRPVSVRPIQSISVRCDSPLVAAAGRDFVFHLLIWVRLLIRVSWATLAPSHCIPPPSHLSSLWNERTSHPTSRPPHPRSLPPAAQPTPLDTNLSGVDGIRITTWSRRRLFSKTVTPELAYGIGGSLGTIPPWTTLVMHLYLAKLEPISI